MKLLLSYAAMLIVPLLLLLLTVLLLVFVFRGDLQPLKSMYKTQLEKLDTDNLGHLLRHTIDSNPDLLINRSYLEDLSGGIAALGESLYVAVDDKPLYSSPAIAGKAGLLNCCPPTAAISPP